MSKVVNHELFRKFDYDLNFIDDNYKDLIDKNVVTSKNCLISTSLLCFAKNQVSNLPNELQYFRLNQNYSKTNKLKISYAHSYNENFVTLTSNITHNGGNIYSVSL